MRSKKGITMMSLVIYVTSFLLVTGIVAGVTAFFYGNSTLMTSELYSAADYNKFNVYMVKESSQEGNRITDLQNLEAVGSSDVNTYYIKFSNEDRFTYDNVNKLLYFNSICLCEDVQSFKATTDYSTGKEVVDVLIGFTNKSYRCKYTMAQ